MAERTLSIIKPDAVAKNVIGKILTRFEGGGLLFTVTLDSAVQGAFDVDVSLSDVSATGGAAPLARSSRPRSQDAASASPGVSASPA